MNAHPNKPQAQEQFAEEFTRRYIELRQWAMKNWPNSDQPLGETDFIASDRELHLLLGARLHPGATPAGNSSTDPAKGGNQYQDITPMPWP